MISSNSGILTLTAIALALSLTAKAQNNYSWNNLPTVQATSFKPDTFNITKYGAQSNTDFLNTDAIQKAIDACNSNGGGVVEIPNGYWLTAPIVLKSNVNLHLADNALLEFTKDKTQFKLVIGEYEGEPSIRNQSPISAKDQTNIAITGHGIVDGNGDAWRAIKKDKLTESQWKAKLASGGIVTADGRSWYPSQSYMDGNNADKPGDVTKGKPMKDYEPYKDFFRPNMIVLNGCKKVLLEGVTFQNSAAWNLHTIACEDLTVRGVNVKNPWYAQNGDGIDIESCNHVLVENSIFDVGDDGICIKSGRDEAGRKRGLPTQNLVARHCTVYHAHGGFVIGSEMSGGANNLFVYDCTFIGTDIGLRFKTTRGRGGIVENIYAKDIVMKDIAGSAVLFDMYYMAKDPVLLNGEKEPAIKAVTYPVTEATPQFRNFFIENIICDGAEKAIFVRGLPEMSIKNISIKNSTFRSDKGIEITEGNNINLENIKLNIDKNESFTTVKNSSDLKFTQMDYQNAGTKMFYDIKGDRTKNVTLSGANADQMLKQSTVEKGIKVNVLK
jgi:polygalacturonase